MFLLNFGEDFVSLSVVGLSLVLPALHYLQFFSKSFFAFDFEVLLELGYLTVYLLVFCAIAMELFLHCQQVLQLADLGLHL